MSLVVALTKIVPVTGMLVAAMYCRKTRTLWDCSCLTAKDKVAKIYKVVTTKTDKGKYDYLRKMH